MSQEPRRSSRPSSVIKSSELEEKLAKRKAEAEIKVLDSRSKALETVRRQELEVFQEEARELSESVDRILDDKDPDNNSDPDQSLEWDSDECNTSPSFVTIDSSKEVSPTVLEIIDDILNSSVTQGEEENLVPAEDANQVIRRNTSTDNNFLASSPVDRDRPVHFNWPPRYPSQEPEDYSNLYYPPLQPRLVRENIEVEEEVFEAIVEEQSGTMDLAEYEARYRVIKLAAKKVQGVKKLFLATDVASIHLHTYESRLKEIREELKVFNGVVDELIVDLDENNADDKVRITSLENYQANLLEEVKTNEREVAEKVKVLMDAQPLTKAEVEQLDLQRKKLQLAEKKEEEEKILKNKKAEIAIVDLSSKIANLLDVVKEVKAAKDLSDQEIKHILPEAKKWEVDFKELTASKVKLDMDFVGLNTDAAVVKKLEEDYKTITAEVKNKLSDLKAANDERGLFALNKQVKDAAAYPEPFHGKVGQNIYKFFEKMKEAFESNQVSEKDRVGILMKYLGGSAKSLITNSDKTLAEAEASLIARYGSAETIWKGILETFKRKCNNPKVWSSYGSAARCDIIAHAIKFLDDAKLLAEDYSELKTAVYSEQTVGVFHMVLPREIITKARELERDPRAKNDYRKTLDNIKLQLELDQRDANQDSAYSREIEENKKSFSLQFNNFNGKKEKSKPTFKKKKFSPDHYCKNSTSCRREWGLLGCAELYKLHTVDERKEFLVERGRCVWVKIFQFSFLHVEEEHEIQHGHNARQMYQVAMSI